jgi:Holliday junction resolvase RusA-like endonuclease
MTVLRFTVPWRPVGVNAQYSRHPGGVHKTPEAVAFHGAVATYGRKARAAARAPKMLCDVDVLITFHFDSSLPDGDGPVKTVLDAMQDPQPRRGLPGAGIYENDRQVRDHVVRKRVGARPARVEVVVGPAGKVFDVEEVACNG